LCELCEHPADLKELRAEIQGLAIGEGTIKQLDDLPILDSFLKEAGRLNQSDSGRLLRFVSIACTTPLTTSSRQQARSDGVVHIFEWCSGSEGKLVGCTVASHSAGPCSIS
jgi:hypothetical protein